jgi:hypothetical protein
MCITRPRNFNHLYEAPLLEVSNMGYYDDRYVKAVAAGIETAR